VIFHAHFGVLIHQGIILKKIQKLKRDILFWIKKNVNRNIKSHVLVVG
jgi:hypothetical protein